MRLLIISLITLMLYSCAPVQSSITETVSPGITQTSTTVIRMTDTPGGRSLPHTPTGTSAPKEDPVLVGAGDIAACNKDGDEATANLLDNIPGTVFTTGDNVYNNGTTDDFVNCYHPSWGRHKDRTYPSLGNHEYLTDGASGYFDYFGSMAGDSDKGYYSYDLGDWHIIVLNSNLPVHPGSEQEQWLREDLAAHPVICTLAYWHHPRFSSGSVHGSDPHMEPLWQALYDFSADIVLAGHDHTYERFAPQNPQGEADSHRGIRQFVVGSGGRSHYPFNSPIANSEVRNSDTFGVLKLTLHADSYSWEFIPEAGKTFTDSGNAPCVTPETSKAYDVLSFMPTDDATIKSWSPDINFGSRDKLELDKNPDDNFLLKFVVTGLKNRIIVNATLRLYNVNGSNIGGNLYGLLDNTWQEDDVTWDTAPLVGSNLIATLGSVSKDNWYEIDVTSFILGNGTFSFRMSTTDSDGADYVSKEGNKALSPQLRISVEKEIK